jgi:PAS domain S-box-containing protein
MSADSSLFTLSHGCKHRSEFVLSLRMVLYAAAVTVMLWCGNKFYGGSFAAQFGFFVCISLVIEIACASADDWRRKVAATTCALAACIFGFILTIEAMGIAAQTEAQRRLDQRTTDILTCVDGAVFAADGNGVICVCSENITDKLGYTVTELIGESAFKLVLKDDTNDLLCRENACNGEWMARHLNAVMLLHKDGHYIKAEICVFALRERNLSQFDEMRLIFVLSKGGD